MATLICEDSPGIVYTTQLVQWATTYVWSVEPPNAGTIVSPDPTGSTQECNSNDNVTYTTSGAANATSYSWTLTPSEAGTHEISVNWGAPGAGYVKVTESNGTCATATLNFYIVIDNCSGIGEGTGPSFSIFPNPVKDELVIRFAGQAANSWVVVINQLGQVLYDHETNSSQQFMINTSTLAKGVYVLRIYGEKGNSERKFIKID